MSKSILVIFDFCDTMVQGQTVSMFLDFLYRRETSLLKKIRIRIRNRFNRIPSTESLNYKNCLLHSFRNESRLFFDQAAEEFTCGVLLKHEHRPVLEKLREHQNQGHVVAILSAGFDVYLEKYARCRDIRHLICTKLKFDDQLFSGQIDGYECIGENKLRKLLERFTLSDYDMKNSYAYSDHPNDIPILSLVGNAVVVHNRQDISWKRNSWRILDVKTDRSSI